MKFAGVLSIIQGVVSILSIWGILICWIPIWMGVVLVTASNHVQRACERGDELELRTSLDKLATYFRIFGVFALIMLIIAAFGILLAILIPVLARARQAALGI
jgi:hypothetical protein